MNIPLGGKIYTLEELQAQGRLGIDWIRAEIANTTRMMEEEITLETPVTGEMIALMAVLSLFTVLGSVGNGLVLFVFSRVRDKTTAQLFMLALALIDLFTCMVIIPFTMFVEYTRYEIKYDFLCKLYQFLITSKVPLSAFIMVAIAFDRYFCICHPLPKIITPWRTKVIIVSLTLFASLLGVITSLAFGVYQVYNPHNTLIGSVLNDSFTHGPPPQEMFNDWTKLGEDPLTMNDVTMNVELRLKEWVLRTNFTARHRTREVVYIGICAPNEVLLGWGFLSVYQKCYTALFLLCLVIVGILYGMIYRFIGIRREKKLQQRLVLCAYVNGENGCGEAGTRTTMVNGNGHDIHADDITYNTTCNAHGLGAGGVYIGGGSGNGNSSPPPLPVVKSATAHHLGEGSSSNGDSGVDVSFLSESGPNGVVVVRNLKDRTLCADPSASSKAANLFIKPVPGGGCNVNSEAVTRVTNSNRASSPAGVLSNVSCGGNGGGGGGGVGGGSDLTRAPSDAHHSNFGFHDDDGTRKNRKGEDEGEEEEEDENCNTKSGGKSPSPPLHPGDSRKPRKPLYSKHPRRLRSTGEESYSSSSSSGNCHQFSDYFRRRRASSPRPPSTRYGEEGTDSLEMIALWSRRDSYPAGGGERRGSHLGGGKGVADDDDALTTGSRSSSFTGTYLETSIEEDLLLSEPGSHSAHHAPGIPGTASLSGGGIGSGDDNHSLVSKCHSKDDDGHNGSNNNNSSSNNNTNVRVNDVDSDECKQPLLQHNDDITITAPTTTMYTSGSHGKTATGNSRNVRQAAAADSGVKSGASAPQSQASQDDNESSRLLVNTYPLNNRSLSQVPGITIDKQVLLTSYVRNLSPACSTSSPNLSPRQSYSDGSRRSTMEAGGCCRPSHLNTTSSSSRRSVSVSDARSPVDSGGSRPSSQCGGGCRKKRWQHFRWKNASIKGSHSRNNHRYHNHHHHHHNHHNHSNHHSKCGAGKNRTIMSYDADRLREENRAANARTALTLFMVTLVFVVAFLPAWLMAHKILHTQLLVFYFYFTYNVANPFIYAFMNAIFKEHLRMIFSCVGRR